MGSIDMTDGYRNIRTASTTTALAFSTLFVVGFFILVFPPISNLESIYSNRFLQLISFGGVFVLTVFFIRKAFFKSLIIGADGVKYHLFFQGWQHVGWDQVDSIHSERMSRSSSSRLILKDSDAKLIVSADAPDYLHFLVSVVENLGARKCDNYTLEIIADEEIQALRRRYHREKIVYLYGLWFLLLAVAIMNFIF
jgi:hypothetical protein